MGLKSGERVRCFPTGREGAGLDGKVLYGGFTPGYWWVMIGDSEWLLAEQYIDPLPEAQELATGHPEYLRLLDEMRDMHVRKAADYGRGVDPLANVRAAADFGVPSWVGVMIRANDKMHRIKSFLANGELKNESVEDSLKDLAAYALIALVLFRESQK